jgi:hypothetical protein
MKEWSGYEKYNKEQCLDAAKNYPYYKALCLIDGKRAALNELKECYKKAME